MKKILRRILVVLAVIYLIVLGCMFVFQRSLLFFPSHDDSTRLGHQAGLSRWEDQGQYLGMKRERGHGGRVWLFTHGNGGQAAGRAYVMHYFHPNDGVYVVEYPGFGDQPGSPSADAINAIVMKAYQILVARYGAGNINVLGESLGTGPASMLGSLSDPPRRITLLVPYDNIASVAQQKYWYLPIRLIMKDQWDNIQSLSGYRGRLDIWGATRDQVIPVEHARNLAAHLPQARYHEFSGGHGWADADQVNLSE
jgi:uncharacterized protein